MYVRARRCRIWFTVTTSSLTVTHQRHAIPSDPQRSPPTPAIPPAIHPQSSPASHPQPELAIYLLNHILITSITSNYTHIFAPVRVQSSIFLRPQRLVSNLPSILRKTISERVSTDSSQLHTTQMSAQTTAVSTT